MASIKNSNKRRKERFKECYERGKVNKKKRDEQNKARAATNISLGLEPTFRHVTNEAGKLIRTRRDTHAWTVARAKRTEARASKRAVAERERIRAEAAEDPITRALARLAQ